MKRLSILLFLLLFAAIVYAAAPRVGSWTESSTRLSDGYTVTRFLWTADSTGTVPTNTSSAVFRGVVYQVITVPDTSLVPAIEDSSGRYPSDNYDIVINNTFSVDVMGGSLQNRDATDTEVAVPKTIDGTEWPFLNNSKLWPTVTNNIIPNARGYIYMYWWER